ncbi:hypothetical protein [Rhodococcus sp. IEGM 1408]|uniref:hypothetical protein n=1 Tax=Rhodococcus sp. IEGM 1408 TaxID=3082220 RepID=UPI0029533C91|nr:hypothetical protein [Rhodococcus sp. IEGM 1408]MDV8003102.1 hypothetical protein [Rhodococcus sp. IEGM 1408]
MARITYSVTATEPWEAAATLATVLDFSINPVTIHEDRVTVIADEDDTEIIGTIRRAIYAA